MEGVHPDNLVVADVLPSLTVTLQFAGTVKVLLSMAKSPLASDRADSHPRLTRIRAFGVAPEPMIVTDEPLSSAVEIVVAACATWGKPSEVRMTRDARLTALPTRFMMPFLQTERETRCART